MVNNSHLLWAPEIIKESNGIACGDTLVINAYRDGTKLYFSFSGDACKVAEKMANYLMDSLSGKEESEIMTCVNRLRLGLYTEEEQWINVSAIKRKLCVDSPLGLLYEILSESNIYEMDTREQSVLACDACVNTKPINWSPERIDRKINGLQAIARELKTMDDSVESDLQRLGLCILSEHQQAHFSDRLGKVSDKDFKLIKKLRLAVLLFNNANQYNLTLDKRIEELATKQIVSLNVANEEIGIVNKYINESNLRIDAVKGGKTNCYYPEGCYRTHMDFDYLAAEFDDAFKFISYLVNERHFKLVIGGSVPFSLKVLLNSDKEEVLTGHIHLEKILQNKYQVVIDVNMGGFPLGRTGIIQCNKAGKIEIEDLICITVSHLFKHEHAFMKDINDLFYLLGSAELNQNLLCEKLERYELLNLFKVAYCFLKKELHLGIEINIKNTVEFSQKRIDSWPMSRKSHFYIKARDMFELNKKQFGEHVGLKETISQICGEQGEILTKKYCDLNQAMNERVYLYPLVVFKKYIDNLMGEELINIDSSMFRREHILILPIGLFLIQNSTYTEIGRDNLNIEIETIMNTLGINTSSCNFDYVMEARKDTWLY